MKYTKDMNKRVEQGEKKMVPTIEEMYILSREGYVGTVLGLSFSLGSKKREQSDAFAFLCFFESRVPSS